MASISETQTVRLKTGPTVIYYGRLSIPNNEKSGDTVELSVSPVEVENNETEDEIITDPNESPPKLAIEKSKSLFIDVIVKNAASPVNFTIQNYRQSKNLEGLESAMTSYFDSSSRIPLKFGDLILHGYYAVKYTYSVDVDVKDKKKMEQRWVRCRIMKPFNENMPILTHLIDHGIYYATEPNHIQQLKRSYLKTPIQSYEAKLHFIEPNQLQFTPEDCRRFQKQVEGKPFCGIVAKSLQNLKGEEKISIILIDTTSREGAKDYYVHSNFSQKKQTARKNFIFT